MKALRLYIKNIMMRFFYCLSLFSRKKSVYFSSFQGQYSDSPRAISEALHDLDSSIPIIWETNGRANFPTYVKTVPYGSVKALKERAQASSWVSHGVGAQIWKPKNIFWVATWHGDRAFKMIGIAAAKAMGENYARIKKLPNYADVNLFTAASDYGVMQAHEGLGYIGEIQKEGLPRNDKLVDVDSFSGEASTIRQSLEIPTTTKILLYAPTFRDKLTEKQNSTIQISQCLDSLIEGTKQDWICLVRAHSHSKGIAYDDDIRIMDVSQYGDMADLLLIADCLITDYSSCAGDFILTNRPCILALFDRDEYEQQNRTLWVKPEDTGFLIANNQQEMNRILFQISQYDHVAIADKINAFYGTLETGRAAMKAAMRIKENLKNK